MRANLVQVKFYDPKSESKQNQSVNVINLLISKQIKQVVCQIALTSRFQNKKLTLKSHLLLPSKNCRYISF